MGSPEGARLGDRPSGTAPGEPPCVVPWGGVLSDSSAAIAGERAELVDFDLCIEVEDAVLFVCGF